MNQITTTMPALAAEGVDTSVDLGALKLANPVMPASGCFGPQLAPLLDVRRLAATVTKTVFSTVRGGNQAHRLSEVPQGMINSVGIPSPGLPTFVDEVMPQYQQLGPPIIVSVGGLRPDDYLETVDGLAETGTSCIELNVSCPNLEHDGSAIGEDTALLEKLVSAVVERSRLPILVKMSPMVTSIQDAARACETAGASAITVANSFPGLILDQTHRPLLGNTVGGVTGPAIKPLALRLAWLASGAVDIPVIGCGGVSTASDLLDYLAVGAAAVQVGTANFAHPDAMTTILDDLHQHCLASGVRSMGELIATLREH